MIIIIKEILLKKGNNHKVIAKRRKRNKNKKTHRGTMDCPNSYMCYSTKDKPYFKSKHNGK